MDKKRINWIFENNVYSAYNNINDYLGCLSLENIGRYMHWCWFQETDIFMSPSCLQEVRDKQKELFKDRKVKK